MNTNPTIMKSVEKLGYRVTVGDVAANAGLELNLARQDLLALASDAGGHLQVADTGEIVFLFPENFRNILRNKYWRLQLQEWWGKVWRVLFYLIRISFGVILILSIVLMVIAIAIILIAATSSKDGDGDSRSDRGSSGINLFFLPRFWFSPDIFWLFSPDYYSYHRPKSVKKKGNADEMSFLEAVFSFLFGDGNPNANLEEKRWQTIGKVIRNNRGAIVAEQISPYLDNVDDHDQDNEDFVLPVLTKFNGYPEVSPEGEIIYYFPDLQVTASQQKKQSVSAYLKEKLWQFSQASKGQIAIAIGLGIANFVLALILGGLLKEGVAENLGGFIAFIDGIYWLLLGYGTGFLGIPLIRYFWLQGRNGKIEQRNALRQTRAIALNEADSDVKKKINYAKQFATEKVITEQDIDYSTEKDLLDQEIENSDKIDQEWQKRLESS